MTSHTPGPWEAANFGRSLWVISGARGGMVGWFTIDVEAPHEHFDANARLIAAAPDLLEALRSIAQIPTAAPMAASSMFQIAAAAITKAEGG